MNGWDADKFDKWFTTEPSWKTQEYSDGDEDDMDDDDWWDENEYDWELDNRE